MGNPESTCSPHEDDCKEAETKLMECAITLPKVKELFFTKGMTEAFKAVASHDEEDKFADYMKGGASRESFLALAECPDGDKRDKQMAMLDCMEAHSDYHHKCLEIIGEQVAKQGMKELESIFPGGEGELFLGVHEFFTKGEGGCCKEQYTAYMDCIIEKVDEGDEHDPLLTTFISYSWAHPLGRT